MDGQPLRVPDVVAGVTAFRTNQIPNAGGSPDATTCSWATSRSC